MLPRLGCFILSLTLLCVTCEDDLSDNTRYVLYDVNPGEGFNLRRDVYMRMAVFVRKPKYGWFYTSMVSNLLF